MGRVSFRGRAGRSLVAPVVVAVALAIAAVPASAKPGGGGGGGNGKGGGVTAAAAPSGATASTTLIPSTWFPGAYCTFDVAYKWTGSGTFAGQPFPSTVYASTVWTKKGDKWIAVFHQESEAAKAAPAKK